MTVFRWDTERELFCSRVAQNRSTLKILLKTKDEEEMLETWLKWHVAICGAENIFILDNMSSSIAVEAIYDANPDVTVCKYDSGFLDNIHNRQMYPLLYDSLSTGAEYYVFLDTDEMITTVVDADHHDPKGTIKFIQSHREAPLFPGIWLSNQPGSRTRFDVGAYCSNIRGGILWGKPVTTGGTKLFSNIVLHNAGATCIPASQSIYNNIFVLHLCRLSSARRIRSNLNKLVHHRILLPGAGLDAALAYPEENSLPPNPKNILAETRWLAANPRGWDDAGGDLTAGSVEFLHDGIVRHPTTEQRDGLQRFLDDKSAFARTVYNHHGLPWSRA